MTSPTITTRTLWTLDVDLLLQSGAMEGPFTRPHPVVRGVYRLTDWLAMWYWPRLSK